jgi:protein-L-isoaspartate(D-aspartate) O-methyltransferase
MQQNPLAGREGYALARRRLVEHLQRDIGIVDRRVLAAFEAVPRHHLVPEALWGQAYRDTPVPIGEGQTISAPSVVATMTEALCLRGDERVLEIGTGSGYQAAILARLADSVLSIERIPRLAADARSALDRLGCTNVVVYLGDGTQGRPEGTPYDRIIVTAGGPEIPRPLLTQLSIEGILVGPFGPRGEQDLVRLRRTGETRFTREVLGRCQFVDLIGRNGWAAA